MIWHKGSLFYPILGLLALTALVSVVSGYAINYAPVHKEIMHRLQTQAEGIRTEIQSNIEEQVFALPRLVRMLQGDRKLRQKLERFQQEGLHGREDLQHYMTLKLTTLGVDHFLIMDHTGRLLLRTTSSDRDEFVETPREVAEAIETRDLILHGGENSGGVMVQAIAPLMEQERVVGVVAIGTTLNADFAKDLAQHLSTEFVLVSPHGVLTRSNVTQDWLPVERLRLEGVMAEGGIQIQEDHTLARSSFYTTVRLLHQTLGLIVFLDLTPSHAPLFDSGRRLVWSGVIILVLVILLGISTYYLLIFPLRRLHGKSRVLLEVCAPRDVHGAIMGGTIGYEGNEIKLLDRAIETASFTVYAHIGKLHEQKEAFETMAVRDALTGLGNRRMFQDLLEQGVALCRRHGGRMALFYMDLDRFKPINDTLGHDVGDLLLKEVSLRLKHAVRDSDVVFRLGGDEFAALLPECSSPEVAREVGDRVVMEIAKPYLLGRHECVIGISIGISLYPLHGKELEELIKQADNALYAAKKAGRGLCKVATPRS